MQEGAFLIARGDDDDIEAGELLDDRFAAAGFAAGVGLAGQFVHGMRQGLGVTSGLALRQARAAARP